ncbi:MAG: glycosyltransferase [Candidatus Omnitrophica bacterium]|nr:glycosyltransferase [Candidatus Omnitrophota bacterium]
MNPKIGIVSSARRPQNWMNLYKSICDNNVEFELVFVGPNPPDYTLPKNFRFIKSLVKPTQCLEIAFRNTAAELVMNIADDCEFKTPRPLDELYALYQSYNCERIIVSSRMMTDGRDQSQFAHRFFTNEPSNLIMPLCGLMSKRFYRQLGGIDRNFIAVMWDLDIALRVYASGGRVVLSNVYVNEDTGKSEGVRLCNEFWRHDRTLLENLWTVNGKIHLERKKPVEPFSDMNILTISQGPRGRWRGNAPVFFEKIEDAIKICWSFLRTIIRRTRNLGMYFFMIERMNKSRIIPTIEDYLRVSIHPLRQTGGCRLYSKRKRDSGEPFVTIITIVKNRKETLTQTIMSVLNQSYPNIEYIVVDGASTDGTLEVIKQFEQKIDLWISEPDSGTSDAFNKAVSLAKGDFIFWLSSDDWIEPGFIAMAVQAFLSSGADFVFGDMVMHKDGEIEKICRGVKEYVKLLMSGFPRFNFPAMVIKRKCFQKIGLIDLSYKFFSDYEWVLRLHTKGGTGLYHSSLLVHRRVGGLGETFSLWSILEYFMLLRQYRLPKTKSAAYYFYYLVRRITGYLAKLFLTEGAYKKLRRFVYGD